MKSLPVEEQRDEGEDKQLLKETREKIRELKEMVQIF